jgi:hypothetical protein
LGFTLHLNINRSQGDTSERLFVSARHPPNALGNSFQCFTTPQGVFGSRDYDGMGCKWVAKKNQSSLVQVLGKFSTEKLGEFTLQISQSLE